MGLHEAQNITKRIRVGIIKPIFIISEGEGEGEHNAEVFKIVILFPRVVRFSRGTPIRPLNREKRLTFRVGVYRQTFEFRVCRRVTCRMHIHSRVRVSVCFAL